MNVLYPAIFEPQESSSFYVQFVDMENVFTCGEPIEDSNSPRWEEYQHAGKLQKRLKTSEMKKSISAKCSIP